MPMKNKLVVAAGGAGRVGEGIVNSYLRADARVVVLSRSQDRIDQLRQLLADAPVDRLFGLVGDTSSFAGMQALAERIVEDHGPVDHATASLDGWWQGKPVWEVSEEEFHQFFVVGTALHYGAARAIVPIMRNGGSYTLIVGLSALLPLPMVSLIGMRGSAQIMLGQELQADVGTRQRINTLILGPVISRMRPTGSPDWLDVNAVGEIAVRVAASDVRGQVIRIEDKTVARRTVEELSL